MVDKENLPLRNHQKTILAVLALWSLSCLAAEPELPAGLGTLSSPTESGSEPSLPAGIGGSDGDEPPMPDGLDRDFDDTENIDGGDAWALVDGDENAAGIADISGFWELRLGSRLDDAPNQRDLSLGEMRLELEKDWQWQGFTAKVTADVLYDDVEPSQRNDLEIGAGWLDLREAWVQHRFGSNVDVKAGRQILTWGVGDLVFINDLFPKDWNSFLAGRDEQYLKAPSDALRLGFYNDIININLIYTPRFDADRYIDGRRLSFFSPLEGEVVGNNNILQVDKPDHSGSDAEWVLRLYRQIASYEVALYSYKGFWKSPGGFNPNNGLAIFPQLQVLGVSARGTLGVGIVSLEAGYYHSKDDDNGDNPFINNDEFRALAGYEWEWAKDTTINVQYYLEALQDYGAYRATLLPGQAPREEYRQLFTLRVTRLAMNQNLSLGLFVFYSPSDDDAYLRPKAHYKINDNWAVEGGMNIFTGREKHSFFGQFEDNTNIYGGVRYSF